MKKLIIILLFFFVSVAPAAYADVFGINFSDTPKIIIEQLTNANMHFEYIVKPEEYYRKELRSQFPDPERYQEALQYLKDIPGNPFIFFDGSLNRNPLIDTTKILFGPKHVSEIELSSEGQKSKIKRIRNALTSKYGFDYKHHIDQMTEYYEWKIPDKENGTPLVVELTVIHQYMILKTLIALKEKTEEDSPHIDTSQLDDMIRKQEEEPPYSIIISYKLIERTVAESEGF